jgi:hypothetical protein
LDEIIGNAENESGDESEDNEEGINVDLEEDEEEGEGKVTSAGKKKKV